ncbi:MAG: hypothetical protein IJ424_08885 [Oscillospiraceae bacterium]|nr:hypothetical protein [Oscillospiraceae bacterium]
MTEENRSFNYTYCAKEQEEIKKIRERYIAPNEQEIDKMEQLRRLDASVTKKASVVSLIIGIIGALIMGTGMSLLMTELGEILGALSSLTMLIGIALGVLGMILIALAYPIYNRIIKKERERIAPEIIRLTDELMK